jgi:hypothetical protein
LSFDPSLLAGVDEPVRRYFAHAIAAGAPLARAVRLQMSGRVKADLWLPFRAEEKVDGRSFSWRARVGLGPLTVVEIADGYSHGVGSSEGRLFGRRQLFAKADEDTARSAAGRAALESVAFAAPSVLPSAGWPGARRATTGSMLASTSRPSDPRSRCASTRGEPSGRSAAHGGVRSTARATDTSPAAAMSRLIAASAT